MRWFYLNGLTTPPSSGMSSATIDIAAPSTAGDYNYRLFANDGFTKLATSGTLHVASATDIVWDRFTGTNGTALTSHTPDALLLGRPWTVPTGSTPVLSNNTLAASSTVETLALVDGGTPNVTVSVRWNPGTGSGLQAALVFRGVDAQNYFLFEMKDTTLYLKRVINGQWATLWVNTLTGEPRQTHALEATLSGSTITVSLDSGVQGYTTTDYSFPNAHLYGVRWTSYDALSTYDDFWVSGTLPAIPASTAITPASTSIVFGTTNQTLTANGYTSGGQAISGLAFDWTSSNPAVVKVAPASINSTFLIGMGTGTATITATPVHGPHATMTVTVTPGSTIVWDSFTDGDGIRLSSHTPSVDQVGAGWAEVGTLTGVVSGQRAAANGPGTNLMPLIDAGTPNVTASVNWYAGSSSNVDGGLIFRATDANNYFLFQVWRDQLILYSVINGQWTQLWWNELPSGPPQGVHTFTAELSGANITLYWDGEVAYFFTSYINPNGSKYGVRWSNYDTTSTYDNFSVTGTLAPPATRVVVSPSTGQVPFQGTIALTATAYDAADQVIPNMNFLWSTSNPYASTVCGASMSTASVRGTGEGLSVITATPSRGPSATATITTNPGNTLISDSFAGTNGTALAAHPPEVHQMNGPWVITGTPAPVLNGGRAEISSAGGTVLALIEGGAPDANVSVKWRHGDGSSTIDGYIAAGLVSRATDAENYLVAYVSDSSVTLSRVSGGTWTMLAQAGMAENYFHSGTHTLEMRFLGSAIEVWLNGERQIEATDSFNAGASKYGLIWWSQWETRSNFDDFSVVGPLPPVVQTITVSPASLAIAPYETTQLTATARDGTGQVVPGAVIAWSSAASSVARINPSAFTTASVTPVAAGTATITAQVPRGTAADVSVTVTVRVCVDPLFSSSASVTYNGGSVTTSLAAAPTCTWRAVPLVSWITISSGASGSGNGTVTMHASANPGPMTRSGHVALGGRLFAITQPPPPNSCVTGMSAGQTSFGADGGTGDFGLVADPNCQWLETSSDPTWLIPLNGFGQGSASPRFSVLPNPTSQERSAVIGVAGSGFTITQAAGPSGLPPGEAKQGQGPYYDVLDDGVTIVAINNYSSWDRSIVTLLVKAADRSTKSEDLLTPRRGLFGNQDRIFVNNNYLAWFDVDGHGGGLAGFWTLAGPPYYFKHFNRGPGVSPWWAHNELVRGSASPNGREWAWDQQTAMEHTIGIWPSGYPNPIVAQHELALAAPGGNWRPIHDGALLADGVHYKTAGRLSMWLGSGYTADFADLTDGNGLTNWVDSEVDYVLRESDIKVTWRFRPAATVNNAFNTYYWIWQNYSFDVDGSQCDSTPTINDSPDAVWGEPRWYQSNRLTYTGYASAPALTLVDLQPQRGVPCGGNIPRVTDRPPEHGDWIQWGEDPALLANRPRWTLTHLIEPSESDTRVTWDALVIANETNDGVWGAGAGKGPYCSPYPNCNLFAWSGGVWYVTSYTISTQ